MLKIPSLPPLGGITGSSNSDVSNASSAARSTKPDPRGVALPTRSQSMMSNENFAATRDGTRASKLSFHTGDNVFFFVSDLNTFCPFKVKMT